MVSFNVQRRGNRFPRPCVGTVLSSQAAARQVLLAPMSLTSVFGMGTGGPSSSLAPTLRQEALPLYLTLYSFFPSAFSGDPCGTRTRVAGVRGRSLDRLTNGPFPLFPLVRHQGLEPGTR